MFQTKEIWQRDVAGRKGHAAASEGGEEKERSWHESLGTPQPYAFLRL